MHPAKMLDTSICIYIARTRPATVARRFARAAPGSLGISVITWGELCFGAAMSSDPCRANSLLEQFSRIVHVLPLLFCRCLNPHTDFCILRGMKTTLDLRDDLVAKAKALAAKERTTLTRMIEEGLALRLRRQRVPSKGILKDLPVSARQGGFRSGLDGTSNRSLFDAADE